MNLKQQNRIVDYKYKTTDKITKNKPATDNDVELDAIAHEED
jgi:hypothetical protein